MSALLARFFLNSPLAPATRRAAGLSICRRDIHQAAVYTPESSVGNPQAEERSNPGSAPFWLTRTHSHTQHTRSLSRFPTLLPLIALSGPKPGYKLLRQAAEAEAEAVAGANGDRSARPADDAEEDEEDEGGAEPAALEILTSQVRPFSARFTPCTFPPV